MSAECGHCGRDIEYPEGTWPLGECLYCKLADERDALLARLDEQEQALGPDLAGRPFADLLRSAAESMNYAGGGPMADCMRAKADALEALAAAAVPEKAE